MAYWNPPEDLFKTCLQESLRGSGKISKTKHMTWSPQSQTSSSGRSSVATFLKTTFTFQSSSCNHLVQFHFDASSPQCVQHLHVHRGHWAVVEHLWTTTLTKNTATATLTSIGNKIKYGQTHSMSLYNQLWLKTTFTITLTPPRVFQREAARDAWTMSECCLCVEQNCDQPRQYDMQPIDISFELCHWLCRCAEQNCDQQQHDTYARINIS